MDRFFDVIVRAKLQAFHHRRIIRVAAYHDDG
jgi:hypothetical protein